MAISSRELRAALTVLEAFVREVEDCEHTLHAPQRHRLTQGQQRSGVADWEAEAGVSSTTYAHEHQPPPD